MRTLLHRTVGAGVAAAVMAAIVWASNAAVTVHGSDRGVLRLAWSARPERVEICHEPSAEELAKLPKHMRQPLVCEGASAQYQLTVRYDGNLVVDRILQGGGLRQDRRLYVFQEVPLEPGRASIEVRLDRIESVGPRPEHTETNGAPAVSGRRASGRPAADTVPPHLSFMQQVFVRPRQVFLVTYVPDRRSLITVAPLPPGEVR